MLKRFGNLIFPVSVSVSLADVLICIFESSFLAGHDVLFEASGGLLINSGETWAVDLDVDILGLPIFFPVSEGLVVESGQLGDL